MGCVFSRIEHNRIYNITVNVYLSHAKAYSGETGAAKLPKHSADVKVSLENAKAYLALDVSAEMLAYAAGIVNTAEPGTPRITERLYDAPDSGPITLDTDLPGRVRAGSVKPRPLEDLKKGRNRFLIRE